ncbi:hypothetical protein AB5I41_30870 [Sphingomonas sp. MMS24-JH45]
MLALQMAANQPGKWSLSGTDASLFSIDNNFGLVRFTGSQAAPAGALDFEDDHGPSYSFSVTLTPYNAALAAVTKAFTLAVTDVSDGSTDPMTTQSAAGTPLENNTALWTLASGSTGGAITYRGDSNGIAMASSGGTALLFSSTATRLNSASSSRFPRLRCRMATSSS